MRKEYEKPILVEEDIQLEDIVAVSAGSTDINDVDHVLSNVPRWGRN